jgi:hypothetical protein
MIQKILDNQKNLKELYYEKMDKLRETFDFNNQNETFNKLLEYSNELEKEIENHFTLQNKLTNQINKEVDRIVLENILVRRIMLNMNAKIKQGAINKDTNIFAFFDDFEEILRAYLKKEEGLFIQELEIATTEEERKKIKEILI